MADEQQKKQRGGKGKIEPRWKKGQSGNPKGVPQWYREVRALLREKSVDAIKRVEQLSRQTKAPKIALAANFGIIDRAGLSPFKVEPDKL